MLPAGGEHPGQGHDSLLFTASHLHPGWLLRGIWELTLQSVRPLWTLPMEQSPPPGMRREAYKFLFLHSFKINAQVRHQAEAQGLYYTWGTLSAQQWLSTSFLPLSGLVSPPISLHPRSRPWLLHTPSFQDGFLSGSCHGFPYSEISLPLLAGITNSLTVVAETVRSTS